NTPNMRLLNSRANLAIHIRSYKPQNGNPTVGCHLEQFPKTTCPSVGRQFLCIVIPKERWPFLERLGQGHLMPCAHKPIAKCLSLAKNRTEPSWLPDATSG